MIDWLGVRVDMHILIQWGFANLWARQGVSWEGQIKVLLVLGSMGHHIAVWDKGAFKWISADLCTDVVSLGAERSM